MIDVRSDVAAMLDVDPSDLRDDENLIGRGLYSLAVMRLVARWSRQGAAVRFGDLARTPTIDAWRRAVDDALAADSVPADAGESDAADGTAFGLGTMQHAYWLGRSATHALGGVAAHGCCEFRLDGIDAERLANALRALVRRHPTLRTAVDDTGMQRVLEDSASSHLTVHDHRSSAPDVAERVAREVRERMEHQMLDASAGHLLDVELTLLPGGAAVLHVDIDIIAADAVSFRLLLGDLARLYEDPADLAGPAAYSYRRYLADKKASTRLTRSLDERYWRGRASSLPMPPQLPQRPGGPLAGAELRTTRRALTIDAERREHFEAAARSSEVTPAALHAALLAVVIGRWSGASRFLLNVPLFNRRPLHPDVDRLVGDFSSSLLVPVDLSGKDSLEDIARALQEELYEAASHADFEGLDVIRLLGRENGGAVVAPVVFTSGMGLGDLVGPDVRRVFGLPTAGLTQGPQIQLDAQVMDQDGQTLLSWDSRDGHLPDGLVDEMWAEQLRLYGLILEQRREIGEIRGALLAGSLAVVDAPDGSDEPLPLLHTALYDRARRDPDRVCLISEDGGRSTYAEVRDAVLARAGELVARGVRLGDRVVLHLAKGPEQILTALAVLSAGAAYVPIGIDQPAERIRMVASASRPALVVTGDLDREWPAAAVAPSGLSSGVPLDGPVDQEPDAPAYVLYTSGSTGVPKGVVVSHRAVSNTLRACNELARLAPDDTTVAISSLEFDLSAQDLFAPLLVGGSIACPTGDIRRDGLRLAALIRAAGVTQVHAVPGVLRLLCDAVLGENDPAPGVRMIMSGGDRIDGALVDDARRAFPEARFFGLGGATETAIHHSAHEVGADGPRDWSVVPFGRTLRGNAVRVVDDLGADSPDWAPGELWVGGTGVADGYLDDPELTAIRFVTAQGLRWWRSGDIVRRRPDGQIEFLGRRDNQIKIRGHRVDLSEIDEAFRGLSWVRAVASAPFEVDGRTLVGLAVTPAEGAEVPARVALRAELRDLLADHMVPAVVVGVPSIPRTAEGKVDVRALRELFVQRRREESAHASGGPADVVEQALATVFADVSGAEVSRIDPDADLFDLGGDSIAVTRLVTEIRRVLMFDRVTVADVFEAGSLRALGARIRELHPEDGFVDAVSDTYLRAFGPDAAELIAAR